MTSLRGKEKVEDLVLELDGVTYKGQCTVWHEVNSGKRPGTLIEGRLSEIEWLILNPKTGASCREKLVPTRDVDKELLHSLSSVPFLRRVLNLVSPRHRLATHLSIRRAVGDSWSPITDPPPPTPPPRKK